MGTVFVQKGYRFFFYSADLDEPIHVHVAKSDNYAKFWLLPIRISVEGGFRNHELNEIERIIKRRSDEIVARWQAEKRKRDDNES